MSYTINLSGRAGSAKEEAEVLKAVADLAEKFGADGTFSFYGAHFQVYAGPPKDGVAMARKSLEEYAASADADDQVEAAAE